MKRSRDVRLVRILQRILAATETLQRMAMNARLVEHAARTPQGSVFENFSSRQYGVPMVAENLPGGASAVSVNTFSRFNAGARVYPAVDEWDKKRVLESSFHKFFGDYINGRMPIREAAPLHALPLGPIDRITGRPKYGRAYGVDSPHGVSGGNMSPLPGEIDDNSGLYGGRFHPAYGGVQTGVSREEMRVHDGDCQWAHPGQSHRSWASSEEEEEESRRRLRSRAKEGYLRTLITESDHQPNCQLRKWAIRKLASSQ